MITRDRAAVIWAAAAASVGAVALYMLVPGSGVEGLQPVAAGPAVAPRGDTPAPVGAGVSLVLPPAMPPSATRPGATGSRFKLVGVVAGGSEGLALIAVDGKPARAFRVGETVEGDIVVRQVSASGATLGPREGGAAVTLDVSLAPSPATSTAPSKPTAPLADGSAQSQETLHKLGSKYPPLLRQQADSTPQTLVEGTAPPVDDGRWKPPGGQ